MSNVRWHNGNRTGPRIVIPLCGEDHVIDVERARRLHFELGKVLDEVDAARAERAMTSTANHDPGDEDRSFDLYCSNCGDPFDHDAENAALRLPHGAWRPCPNPSPGYPLVHCGVGGHMYTSANPKHT